MEKKKYIAPSTSMVVVEAANIIANSVKSTSNAEGLTKGDDVTSGEAGTKSSGSWNVWSSDDE